MVEGQQDIRHRQIIVVDLDGTLITGNSLHEYIKAGMKVAISRGRLYTAARIGVIMMLRCLRLIRHTAMKFGVARIIGQDSATMTLLKTRTADMRSEAVEELIAKYKARGCEVLVASAAFGFYIPYLTDYQYIATEFEGNTERTELRGEHKAKAVEQWLADNKAQLVAVITDHPDDAPLLHIPCPHRYIIDTATQSISPVI